eukprot:12350185-Karenia_brevis.AAC.1
MFHVVLHAVPIGVSPIVELQQRLQHWEACEWTELLTRVEAQSLGMQKNISKQSDAQKQAVASRRAK